MIGELLGISQNEERIMYEEFSEECQRGDNARKKQVHKRHKKTKAQSSSFSLLACISRRQPKG
jgi:hypothetical protein